MPLEQGAHMVEPRGENRPLGTVFTLYRHPNRGVRLLKNQDRRPHRGISRLTGLMIVGFGQCSRERKRRCATARVFREAKGDREGGGRGGLRGKKT